MTKAGGIAFWAAAATLTTPFFANAQSIVYECNLNGATSGSLSGCAGSSTGGYATSTTSVKGSGACTGADYCGANSNSNGPYAAVAPIEAWNVCRWVDNISTGKEVFVPFKTSQEWNTFLTNVPTFPSGSIGISHCAVPYSNILHPSPSTTTFTPTFGGCTSITGNAPDLYGRTGVSLVPATPIPGASFTCHGGSTSMQSREQWIAGDVDATAAGVSSWNQNYQFSPDIILTPSAVVVDEGTPVTLSWQITQNTSAAPLSCSVSPGGWGPDSSGLPLTGSSTVILASTTTFTLTCAQDGLTSTATQSVTGNPPPPPPPPPCCVGDGGGDGGVGG